MNRNRHLGLLALTAAVAALTACGGGGGGDDDPSPAPAPSPGASPAPAPATSTGLTPPTGTLARTQQQAEALVSRARDTYNKGAGGFASRALGSFAPGLTNTSSETFPCPGGGSVTFAPASAGSGTYDYSACVIEGITYSGQGQVSVDAPGGTVSSYTINESAISAIVSGSVVALSDHVECNVVSGQTICAGFWGDNVYGTDFTYDAGTANGTFQCECLTNKWNGDFGDFTATSGQASMMAAVGSAMITRTSATTYDVDITVGSETSSFTVTN